MFDHLICHPAEQTIYRCFDDAGVRQRRFRLRPVLDGARTHVIGDGGLWRPGAGPVRPPGHAVIRSGKCSLHGTAVLCCVAGESAAVRSGAGDGLGHFLGAGAGAGSALYTAAPAAQSRRSGRSLSTFPASPAPSSPERPAASCTLIQ